MLKGKKLRIEYTLCGTNHTNYYEILTEPNENFEVLVIGEDNQLTIITLKTSTDIRVYLEEN